MIKLEYRRRCIGFTPFKWGCYHHLRWKNRWWHVKWGLWIQHGLRVSTRKQRKLGRKPRYCTSYRLHVSAWSTTGSKQNRPYVFGIQVYSGRTK